MGTRSLIEVLVTVLLIAVFASMALPSFNALIRNNQMASQTNDFIRGLQLARSEAVKRGTRITLCKSINGSSCTTSTSASWQDGWLIFADNGTTIGTLDTGEELLRVAGSGSEKITVTVSNFNNWISYLPDGGSDGSGGSPNGYFLLCDERGDAYARRIIINTFGRIATETNVETGACP